MKILFVVTAFYPEQAIGSIRITKLVKYLHRASHEVQVISLEPPPWAAIDESLRFPELEVIPWRMVPQSKLFSKLFFGARNAVVGSGSAAGLVRPHNRGFYARVRGRINAALQTAYSMMKALDWVWQVRSHVKATLSDAKFDMIFTSYPSFASPIAGVVLKRMGIARSVVVDFRDPISYGTSSAFSLGRILERWFCRQAALATFASEGVASKVAGAQSGLHEGHLVVCNGFDVDDMDAIADRSQRHLEGTGVHFAYVGSLYGGKRDLGPFFRAISEVVVCDSGLSQKITLHYAGSEGSEFLRQANAAGVGMLVKDHGRITRSDALQLQKMADICVLSTWNTPEDQGILTGKIFEAFLLRKPLVAVVGGSLPGSEIRRVIESVGAGVCVEVCVPHDSARALEWLSEKIEEKIRDGCVANAYTDAVNAYNLEKVAEALGARMSALAAKRG